MMNLDPSSPEIMSNLETDDREWSVEDIAQIQALTGALFEEQAGEAARGAEPASAELPSAQPIPQPVINPPVLLQKRNVSGRYWSKGPVWELELRVDVDGKRPLTRVSGDFFRISGATKTYFGSFIVNAPTISVTSTLVTIAGIGQYTYGTAFPKVHVTIPRTSLLQPPAAATLRFLTLTNAPGAQYLCQFESVYFRTVEYEEDRVSSATLFNLYQTGTLPSGGPPRELSVVKAFAEAGIQFLKTAGTNVVNMNVGSAWSNAELHTAMETQFSLWQNIPNWRVWLFATSIHDQGAGLRGIMFDQQGRQRQGCAVFHNVIGGGTPEIQRAMLRTYVHELGHCFNLYHSFQKSSMVPPMPDRPAAKSWMNYVTSYPGGAAQYWLDFPFQFDDLETVHLRHAFRNNILIGANNFGIGAALLEPDAFSENVVDESGLLLTISARDSFALGEPVVVEIRLTTTDTRGRQVTNYLHPNADFVEIGIRKPDRGVVKYEPLITHCVSEETTTLAATSPPLEESAYIGYGRDGFYFGQSGIYELRALYHAPDGSRVLSNSLKIRVRHPVTAADENIADAYLDDDSGQLFYLLGSDSRFLESGNQALDEVLDKHARHPLSTYARLVKGINAAREFKTITEDQPITGEREVLVREPRLAQSIEMLSPVVNNPDPGAMLDSVTRDMVTTRLAQAQEAAGDQEGAGKTLSLLSERAVKARGAAAKSAR